MADIACQTWRFSSRGYAPSSPQKAGTTTFIVKSRSRAENRKVSDGLRTVRRTGFFKRNHDYVLLVPSENFLQETISESKKRDDSSTPHDTLYRRSAPQPAIFPPRECGLPGYRSRRASGRGTRPSFGQCPPLLWKSKGCFSREDHPPRRTAQGR